MDEYIGREALINAIATSTEPFTTGLVFRTISNQPAADVAPVRRGHWVKVGNGTTCSECMQGLLRVDGKKAEWVDLSGVFYCPNCGADMREVPNDD